MYYVVTCLCNCSSLANKNANKFDVWLKETPRNNPTYPPISPNIDIPL